MPISEDQELEAIEAELSARQSPAASQEEDFELAMIEQELAERQSKPQTVNPDREASLGFANRARYSIEPLESNRKALLVQEYGQENVMQDEKGNIYLNQNGQFRPVNKEGFSGGDVSDFAGALPEMAGGLVGTVAGLVGGGGVASVPMAAGLGVAGGALGSMARQGLSSTLGTPQVATTGERVAETGMSGVLGGVFGGGGQALKTGYKAASPYVKEALEGASKVFKRSGKPEKIMDIASDITITPELIENQLKPAGKEVFERNVVKEQMEKLDDIALRQNLPRATYAQAAGGKAIQAEDKFMNTPLVGGKVRKQVDDQLAAVKSNIEKNVGKFIDEDSTGLEVGLATKDFTERIVKSTKAASQKLYDHVEKNGKDAMIGKRTFYNKYRDYAAELGLLEPSPSGKMTRTKYTAETGLTANEFKRLQSTLFEGLEAIGRTKSPKIRFQSVDALRKTINNTAEEVKVSNPNMSRLLKRFGEQLDDTTEGVLNREQPKLGEAFKEARRKWAKYKNDQEFLDQFLPDGVENIVKKTMNNTDNIKRLKELVGDNHVKEIGKSYVKDILGNLSKSGVARADSALTAIKKNRAQIIESLGEDTYQNLTDNLYYLNRLNQPLNISRPSMYSLLFSPQSDFNLKKLVVNVATSGKTYADMKGTGGKDILKSAGKNLSKPISASFRKLSDSSPATQGGLANLLSDNRQREGAYYVRGPESDKNKKRNVANEK